MRRILVTLVALIATPAMAATLPIVGPYGDAYGCKVPIQGDVGSGDKDWKDSWILVTPTKVMGHEWQCDYRSVHGTKIAAACSGEGNDGESAPGLVHMSLVENRAAGTATFADGTTTYVLHRCN